MEDGLVQNMKDFKASATECLNPYCSGRWSRTKADGAIKMGLTVLILIVVEDGLVHVDDAVKIINEKGVLILIVVEDGLVRTACRPIVAKKKS